MYKSVVLEENTAYGNNKSSRGLGPSNRSVTFHNSSVEHITVTAVDSETQVAVKVIIRKDEMPDWVLQK